jgi:hypothetical protein
MLGVRIEGFMTWEELRQSVEQLSRDEKVRLLRVLSALLEQDAPTAAPAPADDPLEKFLGCCEGPPDLADRHDDYVYGPR